MCYEGPPVSLLPPVMASSPIPLGWLLGRLRRSLLLLAFFAAVSGISCAVFVFLNGGGAGEVARRVAAGVAASAGRGGGGPDGPDGAPRGRGIVQYYPDNQNKYLFRKESNFPREPVPAQLGPSSAAARGPPGGRYEDVIKEKLTASDGAGGGGGALDMTGRGWPEPNRVGHFPFHFQMNLSHSPPHLRRTCTSFTTCGTAPLRRTQIIRTGITSEKK